MVQPELAGNPQGNRVAGPNVRRLQKFGSLAVAFGLFSILGTCPQEVDSGEDKNTEGGDPLLAVDDLEGLPIFTLQNDRSM